MKHLLGVAVILIVSVITGVAAKAMWYDGWKPTDAAPPQTMAWIKSTADKKPSDENANTASNDNSDRSATDSGANAETSSVKKPADAGTAATEKPVAAKSAPVEQEPEFSGGFPVAKIDMVVDHLTNGTAHFIDAREAYEFEEGHLKGANLLPSSAIYENIENLMAVGMLPGVGAQPIIVYCGGGSCEASHNVAKVMDEFGYQRIYIYVNGWEEVLAQPERFEGLTE